METCSKVPKPHPQHTVLQTKDMPPAVSDPPSLQPCLPLSLIQPAMPKKDDICTTYHLSSASTTKVSSFEDYEKNGPLPHCLHHWKLWLPFHSKSEFSFAEIVHNAGMSKAEINSLVDIVQTSYNAREPQRAFSHEEL